MGLRSGDWLGHSRTLMCFFLSYSFVALAVCFGSLSCWNNHPRPIFIALAGFNAPDGPVHRPFDAAQLFCPLSRKIHPKYNVSTSMFDGGDGVLGVIGSIPPPPNTASWVDAKELDFGLIWPLHFHPVFLWIIGKLDRPVHVLSWTGDLAGVVLGWFHTVLMITETPRGEILHGAPVRGRLTVILCFFHLWIFAPTVINFSPSCLAMV